MLLRSLLSSLCVLCVLCGESNAADPGPWATYRGNPQRTGNTDNVAGPEKPAVLWAIKSNDHFLAAPVPVKDSIYVSGVGAFNRPTITLFPLAAKPPTQPTWSKSAPYLKLASVSSPAVSGDYLIFGDGMHQDSGGLLHCINATTSKPLWQLPLPGDLIHLEGGPVVAGNRVFIGGGAAGAMCVELDKGTLDGKEYDLPTITKMQDAKWKELVAKYEELKAKKDDFAIPPDDSQLLKFTPKKVWQKGEMKWHVDAPVNLAGDKLLVPTSFLDKEKVGERALYALNAETGETVWKRELALNPWGGATVAGDLAIVPGSSIGYYLKELKGAKGDVTALDLKTGEVKWKKDVPGGVVGAVAVADGLAICTATDGKVRAFKLADGERTLLYDCKMPVFAPPAVAAGVAYVADLSGTVHAIDLKSGNAKWTLAAAKEGGAPGMVYGGVTVHGGKIIVATCNLEGPTAGKETVVICIGTK
ncbi:MAG: PQQ-binding-like beta-propeller repeat protein [Planctomycetes bacterium]|nr:PQQ-binding-like beta-propeller repeat protein [Planctomycetota bacterium]